jgi:hypothetical protein
MLVNCPKCGFQQPIDKYCAQCGVDMETFKPAAPPLIQRIFGNTIVQLSLLVVVAGGLGTFLYKNGPSNTEPSAANANSRVQINSNASSSAPAASSFEGQMAPVPADPEAQSTEALAQDIVAARMEGTTVPAATLDGQANPSEKRSLAGVSGPSLIVTYAEVPRASYQALVDATHSTPNGAYLNFTGYSAGILPGLRDLLNAGTFKMKVLHKETRGIASAKTLQWFYGLKDPRTAADIGFTTFVVLADSDPGDNNLRGSMDVQRGWREPAGGSSEYQRRNFPAEFEISTRTGFFMSGVMPPRANIPNEEELTSIDVFKILRSVPFQRGESEFVIFVEFARDSN